VVRQDGSRPFGAILELSIYVGGAAQVIMPIGLSLHNPLFERFGQCGSGILKIVILHLRRVWPASHVEHVSHGSHGSHGSHPRRPEGRMSDARLARHLRRVWLASHVGRERT
jgi:hypothetical protein